MIAVLKMKPGIRSTQQQRQQYSLTLDFLLLNGNIPRRPFFSTLPKLAVLEQMESMKTKEWGRFEPDNVVRSLYYMQRDWVQTEKLFIGNSEEEKQIIPSCSD